MGPTLLRGADHHQLLADVSAAVHRDEKLPHIFLHRLDPLGEEHRRLWSHRKRGKGNDMCNNLKNKIHTTEGHRGRMLAFVLALSLSSFFLPFSFSFLPIEAVVLHCAYSYSKITQEHSLMQPEVLFKDAPLEVFLAAWCVVLNYTCESLRANQLGVLHFDSLHGGVSETVPPFFLPPSLVPLCVRERLGD